MNVIRVEGVRIAGICSCLPPKSEDSLERCRLVYDSEAKAQGIVKATGIRSRRVLEGGATALDLSVKAAQTAMARTGSAPTDIGAVVYVTFTPERLMPANACVAQSRLGLSGDVIAFDLNLACSGWLYGVYVASLMAKSLGRKVLLLDGDSQTPHLDPNDAATVPLLSDAGTATIVEPSASSAPFDFAFCCDGAKGDALQLPFGGTIAMDGYAVFKFVTVDVLNFIREFMQTLKVAPEDFDAFVPHQANVYMIRQVAKRLGFAPDRLKVSGDIFGNSSSSSVPTTIAHTHARGTLLASGFGGGLSASSARLTIDPSCSLVVNG